VPVRLYDLLSHQVECRDKFNGEGRAPTPSVLIGDEMRLGKTIEGIERDLRLREYHGLRPFNPRATWTPTLIVCPKNVRGVWEDHYENKTTGLRVCILDPKNRGAILQSIKDKKHDIYVVHWEALRLKDMAVLQQVPWMHLIADEVHRAKNRKAQQTVALKRQKTRYKTGLSGTPGDNQPSDLWSVLNWLYPKSFGSFWKFYERHVDYETDQRGFRKVVGVRNVDLLHKEVRPFFLRRRNQGMKGKFYSQVWVDLEPAQRRAYDQMKKNMLAWVGQHEDQPVPAPVVVAQLIRLQQFASAYATLEWREKKVRKQDDGSHLDENGNWRTVKYQVVVMTEPASKLDAMMELIADHPDQPFVVGASLRQLVELLAVRLEAAGISHGLYTGMTSEDDRTKFQREFQKGNLQVIAGTIATMREGINLSRAPASVVLTRDWNPAWNQQFEARIADMNEGRMFNIIDIMAKNTVDLGRKTQIEQKWTWIQQMLGDNVLDYQKRMTKS
jgi:ATP-dependent helicase STH1/SNF2